MERQVVNTHIICNFADIMKDTPSQISYEFLSKLQINIVGIKSMAKLVFSQKSGGCENVYKLPGRQFGNMH